MVINKYFFTKVTCNYQEVLYNFSNMLHHSRNILPLRVYKGNL